ncbi:hypothetical protein AMTRI_Chr02g222860 [Amborella trichopoda]
MAMIVLFMFRHLEKEGESLMETYRSMSHQLHRLQVEEEMLMRKFYEFMSAQGLLKKKGNVDDNVRNVESGSPDELAAKKGDKR